MCTFLHLLMHRTYKHSSKTPLPRNKDGDRRTFQDRVSQAKTIIMHHLCSGGGGETRRETLVDASDSILLNNRLKHEGYMGASISGLNYVIYVEKIGQNRSGAL